MNEQRADVLPYPMTLEQCHDGILKSLGKGTAGHYRIGMIYNRIVDNRLAVNRGYRTTREYFRHHVRVLSQSTLTRYGEVTRFFHLPVAEKYGMARLGMLMEYLRLAHIGLWQIDRKEPGSTPIEVPRKGALKLTKAFADCTEQELREAILARRAWPGHGPLEPEEEPVQRYLEALGRHFRDHAQCHPDIDAEVHGRRLHVRIRHLRVWELPKLATALEPAVKESKPAVPAPVQGVETPSPAPLAAPPGVETLPPSPGGTKVQLVRGFL